MNKLFQQALDFNNCINTENIFFIDDSNLRAYSYILGNFTEQFCVLNGPKNSGKSILAKKWLEIHPDQLYINCRSKINIDINNINYVTAIVIDDFDKILEEDSNKLIDIYNKSLKYNIKILFVFESFFIIKDIYLRSIINNMKILNINKNTLFIKKSIIKNCFALKNIIIKDILINSIIKKFNKLNYDFNKNKILLFIDKLIKISNIKKRPINAKLIKDIDF